MSDQFNCGIYKITNKVNGKIYIGCSVNIKKRFQGHKGKLRLNKHHNPYLQNCWNKNNEDNFAFEIILLCNKEELEEKEKYFISLYKSNNRIYGYNIESGGNYKKEVSKETRAKISKNQTGRVFTEETRKKISVSNTGRVVTEETKYKLKLANIGKKHTIETKDKLRELNKGTNNHNYGIPMKEEQKEKISNANMGHSVSEETKEKIREARANQPITQGMLDALSKNRKDFTGITGESHPAYGCKHSKEAVERSSMAKWKTVLQIDPNTNEIINKFPNIKEAALKMGFKTHSNISSCCNGKKKTVGGFIWQFEKP